MVLYGNAKTISMQEQIVIYEDIVGVLERVQCLRLVRNQVVSERVMTTETNTIININGFYKVLVRR